MSDAIRIPAQVQTAAAIARLTLPLVPGFETRPRQAIEAAEAWTRSPSLELWVEAQMAGLGSSTARETSLRGSRGSAAARACALVCARDGSNTVADVIRQTAGAWIGSIHRSLYGDGVGLPPGSRQLADWHVLHGQLTRLLGYELTVCGLELLAVRTYRARSATSNFSPLDVFLTDLTQESALVALDWLHEERDHGRMMSGLEPLWAFSWIYAHCAGVAR